MRVFVTGATGFIGTHVARQLRDRGDDVVALARNPARAGDLEDRGVELVPGDILDPAALDAMADCDAVLHLAGWYRVGVPSEAAEAVNVDGTRNVLQAMQRHGIEGVHVSTLAVHSDTRGEAVDEGHRFDGRHLSVYDRTKWQAHYEVAMPMLADGLPLTIAMPGVVYGPGDHSPIAQTIRQHLQRDLPAVPATAAYCWAHVEDTARGVIQCLDHGRRGEAYHIAGPPHRLGEALDIVAGVSGVPAPMRTVGRRTLGFAAAVMRVPDLFMHLPATFHPETLRVAPATYLGDSSKARRDLGWDPRPLAEGLPEVVRSEMRGLGMQVPDPVSDGQ